MQTLDTFVRNSHNSILLLELKQIENDIKQLNIHLTTLQAVDESEDVNERISEITSDLDILIDDKQRIEDEIKQTSEISSLFRNKIDLPECSDTDQAIKWKTVYTLLPNKVDGTNRQEFANSWNVLETLTKTHEWSQQNIIQVLNCVLGGEAYQFWTSKKDLEFEERLQSLLTLYMPVDNINVRKQKLKSYERKVGETLTQFILRLEFLVDRTNVQTPPYMREGRKSHILEMALMKVCSKTARDKIEIKNAEAMEVGRFLTINEKVAIAEREEAINRDAAEYNIPIFLDYTDDTLPQTKATVFHNEAEIIDDNIDEHKAYALMTNNNNREPLKSRDSRKAIQREDLYRRRSLSRVNKLNKARGVSFDLNRNKKYGQRNDQKSLYDNKDQSKNSQLYEMHDITYKDTYPTAKIDQHTKILQKQQEMLEAIQKQLQNIHMLNEHEKQTTRR